MLFSGTFEEKGTRKLHFGSIEMSYLAGSITLAANLFL
jgi:hypothetical protein